MRTSLPLIRQAEEAECGLACLAMVLGYYGYVIDLSSLRQRHRTSTRGMSMAQMVNVAHRLHLATRALRVEPQDINNLRLPCILHWDRSHFVVVANARGNAITIHDPAYGKRSISAKELNERFTGVVLELWPNEDFRMAEISQPVALKEMFSKTDALTELFVKGALFAVLTEVFALTIPLLFQRIVDRAILNHQETIAIAVSALILFSLCEVFASAAKGFSSLDLSNRLRISWDLRLLSHLVRLPTPYFERRSTGDILTRFDASATVRHTITESFVDTCLSGLVSLVTLIAMFLYDPRLTLVVVAGGCLYLLVRQVVLTYLREARREHATNEATLRSHFIETLTGIRVLKLFREEQHRIAHWFNLLINAINAQSRTDSIIVWVRVISNAILRAQLIAVFALGSIFVLHSRLSLGAFFAFIAYQTSFNGKLFGLIDKLYEMRMLDVQLALLSDIVREPTETLADYSDFSTDCPAAVLLDDVSFRYSEFDPWIFQNLSLRINAGDCVAIVGRSGVGKSTLLKLLCGLAVPSTGTVRIVSSEDEVLGNVARVGVVLQDDTLFSGTLAQNIHFFCDEPDMQRVKECAKLAALDYDVSLMRMGYDTQVGTGGASLSGGQRQRLLIARALYRKPSLLVFDEATSHLDLATESCIDETLRQLAVTRVIAAHRPETIAIANRIFLLEGNLVSEVQPSFRERFRKNEHFVCS